MPVTGDTHFWQGWRSWRHVIKVDPDRPLSPARLKEVLDCGTDAAIVGGTQGISAAKVSATLSALTEAPFPVVVEVSSPEALVLGPEAFLIPVVLNAGDPHWIVGAHQQALAAYLQLTRSAAPEPDLPWSRLCPEGYIILNQSSAAARLTSARGALGLLDILAYAEAGEGLLQMPIIYLEYSGTYGDEAVIAEVRKVLGRARLFYGGGIDGPERAGRMARLAHTVVVGNLVHTGSGQDLAETVAVVRETAPVAGRE